MFSNLCRSIIAHGIIDEKRAPGQFRVNLGCGGQHFPNGKPAVLVGTKLFEEKLDSDDNFNSN